MWRRVPPAARKQLRYRGPSGFKCDTDNPFRPERQEHSVTVARALTLIATVVFSTLVQAAEPAAERAARPAPPPPLPLLFKETWTQTPAAVPLSQEVVSNPALALTVY